MAISEEQVISFVKIGLGTVAAMLPPPFNIALAAVGELIDPVLNAVTAGGTQASVVEAVKAALVTASDADMKATLGADS